LFDESGSSPFDTMIEGLTLTRLGLFWFVLVYFSHKIVQFTSRVLFIILSKHALTLQYISGPLQFLTISRVSRRPGRTSDWAEVHKPSFIAQLLNKKRTAHYLAEIARQVLGFWGQNSISSPYFLHIGIRRRLGQV
jgi:hypothetical protein